MSSVPSVSEEDWRGFVAGHPELGLQFTDDELIAAVRGAIDAWNAELAKHEWLADKPPATSARTSSIAAQLRPMPSRADVSRVLYRLRGLERKGLVHCERPRFGANQWRLA